jgi:hypothetical protein
MEAKVVVIILGDVVTNVHKHSTVEWLAVDLLDDEHPEVDVVLKVRVHKV